MLNIKNDKAVTIRQHHFIITMEWLMFSLLSARNPVRMHMAIEKIVPKLLAVVTMLLV